MANDAYDDLFDTWGQRLNVDPQLVKTVFHLESNGDPNAPDGPLSPDGGGERAVGGMQILPATAKAMASRLGMTGPLDLHDMNQAVPLATAYLAEGLNATQNPSDAMAYYFAGPDPAKWGPKTESYVERGERLYPTMALKLRAAQ